MPLFEDTNWIGAPRDVTISYSRVVPIYADNVQNPTAQQIEDLDAIYQLNVSPFTRYFSNGSILVEIADKTSVASIVSTLVITAQIDAQLADLQTSISALELGYASSNQLENKTGVLPSTQVSGLSADGQTFATIQQAVQYAIAKAGSITTTAPVLSVVPTVNDSTADEGQSITITKAVWTGTQPASWFYEILIGGSATPSLTTLNTNTSTTVFAMPAVPAGALRTFVIRQQLVDWPGVNATSAQGTINAVASPVPQTVSRPTISISSNTLTGNHGLYDMTVNSYTQRWLDSANSVLGTGTTLDVSTLGGLVIRFAETPTGANGAGPEAISDPVTIASSLAPTYDSASAELPTWLPSSSFIVDGIGQIDLGLPINNPDPSKYNYQIYRDGSPILGATGSSVTRYQTYTFTSLDEGHIPSFQVTAGNSNPSRSESVTVAGEVIGPAIASAGMTFVNSSVGGAAGLSSTGSIAIPAGAVQNDLALLIVTTNSTGATVTTPSGWTSQESVSVATPEGQRTYVFSKVLGASETSPLSLTIAIAESNAAAMAVWRGPTRVVDATSSTNSSANTSPVTVTAPTATADAANQKLVVLASLDPTAISTVSWNGTGLTQRAVTQWDFATSGGYLYIGDKDLTASGASGTTDVIATGAISTSGWLVATVILGQ